MSRNQGGLSYAALRCVVADVLINDRMFATATSASGGSRSSSGSQGPPNDTPEASRLAALVDLAREGDAEAFGALYDHYNPAGLPLCVLPGEQPGNRRGPRQ